MWIIFRWTGSSNYKKYSEYVVVILFSIKNKQNLNCVIIKHNSAFPFAQNNNLCLIQMIHLSNPMKLIFIYQLRCCVLFN